jgi:hypothetical protein
MATTFRREGVMNGSGRPISIATSKGVVYVLCDDGSIWQRETDGAWARLTGLPWEEVSEPSQEAETSGATKNR